jgi:hypothetical protein
MAAAACCTQCGRGPFASETAFSNHRRKCKLRFPAFRIPAPPAAAENDDGGGDGGVAMDDQEADPGGDVDDELQLQGGGGAGGGGDAHHDDDHDVDHDAYLPDLVVDVDDDQEEDDAGLPVVQVRLAVFVSTRLPSGADAAELFDIMHAPCSLHMISVSPRACI